MKPLNFAAAISTLFFALLTSAPANAVPIEYIFNGTFDGTLGTTTFTNQAFTASFVGSTTSVTSGGGEFFNASISNQFTIGATTGSFTGVDNQLVLNPSSDVVIFNQLQLVPVFASVGAGVVASPLSAYNLATAFPVTSGTVSQIKGSIFQTTLGDLAFNDITALSFEAVINDQVLQTPIPGAFPLFGSAFGLMGFAAWRNRRQNASVRG